MFKIGFLATLSTAATATEWRRRGAGSLGELGGSLSPIGGITYGVGGDDVSASLGDIGGISYGVRSVGEFAGAANGMTG